MAVAVAVAVAEASEVDEGREAPWLIMLRKFSPLCGCMKDFDLSLLSEEDLR